MTGLVLAGGQSKRMGQNKALLCYQELPQYKVVLKLIQPFCNEVWISSASILDPNYRHIGDGLRYKNHGPIAGLLSAFTQKQDDYFVIAIDYPFLDAEDVEILFRSYQVGNCTSVMYNKKTQFYEPYLGIYIQYDLATIEHIVKSTENFSLQKWLVSNNILQTNIPDDTHLQSIDTLEQYNKFNIKKL
jgi:molybdenum cofactor guanylyltransferase